MKLIDKIALLYLKEGRILSTRSRGKDVYYIPGGKREAGESDLQTLVREIREELCVDIQKDTVHYYGTFEAPTGSRNCGNRLADYRGYGQDIAGR